MTNLKLSSNFVQNALSGVGKATLENETIIIEVESGTTATLLRGINKVILLQPTNVKQSVSGNADIGDVYTLENGENKLVIKVETEDIRHETNLFVNTDSTFDATSTKRKTTLTAGVLILILLTVSVIFGIKQKNQKALDVKTKLEEKIAEERSKYEIKPEIKELLDLTLQINGFNGNKLVSTGETMFVLDEKEKNIIQLDVNGKNAKIVAKKDVLDGVNNIASYEERLFTLNNDGIYEIDDGRTKVKDAEWTNPLFYLYSANIYLVDRSNNQILRYSGNGKTFGDKADWLAPGIEVDFSKVVDMAIDGSIWLLSSSGKVTRFTNGNPTSITMNGIVSPLENPTAIYTNEDLKNVYVLDKDNGRVVVMEKNGDFKIQYVSDQLKNATDLVVNEESNKIILLSGSKLVYFEPKQ